MEKRQIENIQALIREKGNDVLKELKDEVLADYATSLELSAGLNMENKDEMNHEQLVNYIIQMRRTSWIKYLKESGKIANYPVKATQVVAFTSLCDKLNKQIDMPTNSLDMYDVMQKLIDEDNLGLATPAQEKLLTQYNMFVEGMTKGQANKVITANPDIFNKPSPAMITLLKKLISDSGLKMAEEEMNKLDKKGMRDKIEYFMENSTLIRLLKKNTTFKTKEIFVKINAMTKEQKAKWQEELLLEETKDMFAGIE